MKTILPCMAMMLFVAGPVVAADQAATSAPDPAELVSRVMRALENAEGVTAKDITLSTHSGTLVLTGHVRSEAERRLALRIAEQAVPEARVISHLQMHPEVQVEQQAALRLVREVELTLRRDSRTAHLGVSVSIDEQGVIGLHGLVPSAEGRELAAEVAGKVEGVGQLRNHLIIPGE